MTNDVKIPILITGGSGFLGINLVRHLIRTGFENLTVLDIADFEYPDVKNKIRFIKGDVRDRQAILGAMADTRCVVHTAAALPLYKAEDIYSTEVEGTKNILAVSLQKNVDRFIHISSTAVYGIPDHHPLLETDKLDGVGPYGNAKILAEEACLEYRQKSLCVSILRPKSFVGPERLGVFALLYDWAKDSRNFPMIGSGTNRYQLLDVEDLCDAITLCISGEKTKVNDTFNIGAREFATMREDFQAVLDHAGFGKKIVSFPASPVVAILKLLEFFRLSPLYKWIYETASEDSYVSIAKAERVLGFQPRYSNKQALIRNFQWYLDHLEQIEGQSGISHRVPWKQGVLGLAKRFF
jgi:nucleoside-diphosphate-sugar epimerase